MQTCAVARGTVRELEGQLAGMKGGAMAVRGIRARSFQVAGLPFYDIALGPDLSKGEMRGHARGFIAIGDMATGVFALGGLARGVVACGGLALGLVTFGGMSIGILAAVGGLAIGGIAFGGGAIGGVALGGGAVGYYACGGGAAGAHVVDATHRDIEAVEFFREYGLAGPCAAPEIKAFGGKRPDVVAGRRPPRMKSPAGGFGQSPCKEIGREAPARRRRACLSVPLPSSHR